MRTERLRQEVEQGIHNGKRRSKQIASWLRILSQFKIDVVHYWSYCAAEFTPCTVP